MKVTDITLEGQPEKVEYYNDEQLNMDHVTLNDINSYDLTVQLVKAYYKHVVNTENKEDAYKAVIQAVSEAIEIDILDDLETEKVKLQDEVNELKECIQDIIEG